MYRSILAVLSGVVVILIASFGIEFVVNPLLMRTFLAAPPNEKALSGNQYIWILTFFYIFLCVIAGGYVTARLAGPYPNRHALALGLTLTIPATMTFLGNAPVWRWILSMIVMISAAWCGGLIYSRRLK